MRFQTIETVQTPDSEIVLRALEATLQEVSNEVVRDGHQITLRGLGPSPRARNPRDITILQVSSDDATTVIHVDVNFQASALLGTASQDSVVRSKLDYVFDQVRTQLRLETEHHSDMVLHPGVLAAPIDSRVVEMPHPPAESAERPVRPVMAEAVQAGLPVEAHEAHVDEEPVAAVSVPIESPRVEPVVAVAAGRESGSHESASQAEAAESTRAIFSAPVAAKPVEPLPVVAKALPAPGLPIGSPIKSPMRSSIGPAVGSPVKVAGSAAEHAKGRREAPMLQFSGSRAHRTHVPALIAAIIALLLLFAVAAYYLLRANPAEPAPTSLPAETQPVNQSSLFRVSLSRSREMQVQARFL